MPWTNPLPPDNQVTGSGSPASDMNSVVDALTAMGATLNVQNPALAGGADPTGVADSTTAIQAAITAATVTGGAVYFPAGIYLITSTLSLTGPVRLTGDGIGSGSGASRGSLIRTPVAGGTTFNVFSFPGSSFGQLYIDHLGINQNGTGDMFNGVNMVDSHFSDLQLACNGSAGSILQMSGTNAMINCLFEKVTFSQTAAVRSVPLLDVVTTASGNLANNTFLKCKFNNGGSDNTQYMVLLSCTGGANAHYANTFRDCYFEHPFGGAIQSMSGTQLVIDACEFWDIFASLGVTIGNDLVYVGTNSGAQVSQGTVIRNCGRNLDGPDGSATWDVYLEATVNQTVIENYAIKNATTTENDAYFNLNSAPNVVLINNQAPVSGGSGAGNELSKTVLTSPNLASTTMITGATVWPSANNWQQPSGTIAATCDRVQVTAAQTAGTSGQCVLRTMWLPARLLITNLTFVTNTTVKTAGTHGWYAIADNNKKVLGVTADQTDTATVWGTSNTAYPLALGTAFVTPYTGLYWVGVQVTISGGSVPTFDGQPAMSSGFGSVDGQCGTNSTYATTPPTVGQSFGSISGTGNQLLYALLS